MSDDHKFFAGQKFKIARELTLKWSDILKLKLPVVLHLKKRD